MIYWINGVSTARGGYSEDINVLPRNAIEPGIWNVLYEGTFGSSHTMVTRQIYDFTNQNRSLQSSVYS